MKNSEISRNETFWVQVCCHQQRMLVLVCSECQRAFYSAEQLRDHLVRMHVAIPNGNTIPGRPSLVCLLCEPKRRRRVFQTYKDLEVHCMGEHNLQIKPGDMPWGKQAELPAYASFLCPMCTPNEQKCTFSSQAALETHIGTYIILNIGTII